jgi:hypothetical protein
MFIAEKVNQLLKMQRKLEGMLLHIIKMTYPMHSSLETMQSFSIIVTAELNLPIL